MSRVSVLAKTWCSVFGMFVLCWNTGGGGGGWVTMNVDVGSPLLIIHSYQRCPEAGQTIVLHAWHTRRNLDIAPF